MKIKGDQLELRPCASVFNLAGERGLDSARVIAEFAEAMRRERESLAWQEKMQRKLFETPGFIGCQLPGVESPGKITVQSGCADQAVDFLKRRFHVCQVEWQKGLGMIIEVLARRKGMSKAIVLRRLARLEQYRFTF